MKIDSEKLLTVAQAAGMLGISKQAIDRAMREHRLKELRIGGHIFIPLDEVMKYKADPAKIKLGKHAARKRMETNGK
jgi:excisionase family DNA binding protein